MSFAEILLRTSAAVGGWLVFAAHGIALLAVSLSEDNFVSDGNRIGTAALAALAALALVGVSLGLPYRRRLRWIALTAIAPAIGAACVVAARGSEAVGSRWLAFQAAVLLLGIVQAARHWQSPSSVEDDRLR